MHSGSYSDSSDKWKSDSTKYALSPCYVRHVISYWRVTGEPRRCFPLSLDQTHTPLVVGSALSTLMFISFSSIGSVRRDVAVNVDTQPLHPLPHPPPLRLPHSHKISVYIFASPPPAHFIMFHFQIPFCMFSFCRISLQFLLCQKFWNTRERFLEGGQLSFYGRH